MSSPAAYVAILLRPVQVGCLPARFPLAGVLGLRAVGLFGQEFHLVVPRLPWKCWGGRFFWWERCRRCSGNNCSLDLDLNAVGNTTLISALSYRQVLSGSIRKGRGVNL